MNVRDLLSKLKDLPPDAQVCVAEVEEAFAANIAEIELVEDGQVTHMDADGTEAVELANGQDKVVVIRW